VQPRIEVDEGKVLPLFGREGFCRRTHAGHPIQLFVRASLKEAGMNVRYRVELSQVERAELEALLSGGNLERALSEEPRPGAERKLTGKDEALLVATACASPPKGCARWTLKLLADAIVKLTEHNSLSHETVRRRLAE